MTPTQLHHALYAARTVVPTDYEEHGGQTQRDGAGCSCGCRHASWLRGPLRIDWCVCLRPDGPRFGLLTFEHQAGACFEGRGRARGG